VIVMAGLEAVGDGVPTYHEKQWLLRCGLHAVNNLLQTRVYTPDSFNNIATTLTPRSQSFINPHKSILGLGDYDVNVITTAITSQGYDVVWFDKRKPVSSINMKEVFGFIVNVPRQHSPWLYMFTSSSHWYAVRSFSGIWYSLDSKLAQPQIIDDLKGHLKRELSAETSHLIIVNWRKQQPMSVTAVTATDEEVEQTVQDFTE